MPGPREPGDEERSLYHGLGAASRVFVVTISIAGVVLVVVMLIIVLG
jgi:type IV secretory pathway VirB3-like protein